MLSWAEHVMLTLSHLNNDRLFAVANWKSTLCDTRNSSARIHTGSTYTYHHIYDICIYIYIICSYICFWISIFGNCSAEGGYDVGGSFMNCTWYSDDPSRCSAVNAACLKGTEPATCAEVIPVECSIDSLHWLHIDIALMLCFSSSHQGFRSWPMLRLWGWPESETTCLLRQGRPLTRKCTVQHSATLCATLCVYTVFKWFQLKFCFTFWTHPVFP